VSQTNIGLKPQTSEIRDSFFPSSFVIFWCHSDKQQKRQKSIQNAGRRSTDRGWRKKVEGGNGIVFISDFLRTTTTNGCLYPRYARYRFSAFIFHS
jgi:hypothetical protein